MKVMDKLDKKKKVCITCHTSKDNLNILFRKSKTSSLVVRNLSERPRLLLSLEKS